MQASHIVKKSFDLVRDILRFQAIFPDLMIPRSYITDDTKAQNLIKFRIADYMKLIV